MFGFDEIRGQRCDLVIAELGVRMSLGGASLGLLRRCFGGRLFRNFGSFRCVSYFSFGAGIGQQPARESSGKPARHIATAGRGWNGSCNAARRDFLGFLLFVVNFVLDDRRRRSCGRWLVAIFCERFAREQNFFLCGVTRSGRSGIARVLWPPIVEAALLRAARLKTTRLAAAIFVTAGFTATRLSALRGCVLRGRQVAPAARTALWRAATTSPSATPAPSTSVAATVARAIAAALTATVTATSEILAWAIIAAVGTRRVVLRGIVVRRKILRCGSVGFRLAFVKRVDLSAVPIRGSFVMFFNIFTFRARCIMRKRLLFLPGFLGMRFIRMRVIETDFFVGNIRVAQCFPREQFDGRRVRNDWHRNNALLLLVPVAVIVVFEVFEYVADVEESIAVEADVHESRLHSGKDAGNSAFVDAADQCELFFALDVDFD
jgi:hypothetical protein